MKDSERILKFEAFGSLNVQVLNRSSFSSHHYITRNVIRMYNINSLFNMTQYEAIAKGDFSKSKL